MMTSYRLITTFLFFFFVISFAQAEDLMESTNRSSINSNTDQDNYKLSFSGHVTTQYEAPSSLYGGEIIFSMKLSPSFWWTARVAQIKTQFDRITQNHSSDVDEVPGSEATYRRPSGVDNTLFSLGVGVGYRFQIFSYLSSQIFETIEIYANRIQLDESFIQKNYSGYGLSTQLGIHKRTGEHFFYGGKFTYNISQVTREQIASEKVSQRSLSLGWTSLALEIGVYF